MSDIHRVEILGSEWFPRDEAERRELLRRHIHGTRHSNWGLLTDAARSSLSQAAVATGRILTIWARQVDEGIHPAEADFLVLVNYSREIIGPVLGAIMSSVFALESFTQLAMTEIVEATYETKQDRHRALSRFERTRGGRPRAAAKKVVHLVRATQVQIPAQLECRIDWLFSFRNDLAHDSPILFTDDGLARRSHGSEKLHDPGKRYGEWMPSLHEGNVPVDIWHGLEAARLHDLLVERLLANPIVAEIADRHGSQPSWRITKFGPVDLKSIERMAKGWTEDYLPWRASIPAAQKEECYRRMVRKAKVKPVEGP